MARIEIRLPEFSGDASEVDLLAWLVKVGDDVQTGDLIAEIETDKSTVEFESPASGRILELAVPEGATIQIGDLLAVLEGEGAAEPTADSKPPRAREAAAAATVLETSTTPEATPPSAPPPTREPTAAPQRDVADRRQADSSALAPAAASADEAVAASALARRIAARAGLDLASLTGSGANGRVVKADVEAALATGAPLPIRARAADDLLLRVDCDVDALFDLADSMTTTEAASPAFTLFAIRALSQALAAVPEANRTRNEGAVEPHPAPDVGVVIERDGRSSLLVLQAPAPFGLSVLRDQLAAAVDESGRPVGASLSSVGDSEIDEIAPPLHPPCCVALGVGAVRIAPVVREGQVVVGRRVRCTLVADAEAVGEAAAARLLAAFRDRLADPLSMLL